MYAIRSYYVAPVGVKVRNLAFDVTPAAYVTAIITEKALSDPKTYKSSGALMLIWTRSESGPGDKDIFLDIKRDTVLSSENESSGGL